MSRTEVNPTPRVPHRPWWVRWRFLIVLAILALCLIGGWYWNRRLAEAELEVVLKQWDAQGVWRWNDWLATRPEMSDEDNGAPVLDRMNKLRPRHLDNDLSDALFYPEGDEQPNHVLHPEQAAELHRRIERCREMMALLPEYERKKEVVWRIPAQASPLTIMFDGVDRTREMINRLRDVVQSKLHEGKVREACQSLRLELSMTRNLDHQLTFIGRLVQIANISYACSDIQRILAQSEPDDALLAELQSTLARYDEQHSWRKTLLAEAGAVDHMIRDLQKGNFDISRLWGGASTATNWWETQMESITSYFQTRALLTPEQHARCMRSLLEIFQRSSEPWDTQRVFWNQFDQELKASKAQTKLDLRTIILPAITKVGYSELKMHAQLRATMVALAAERFRRANKRWPASQQELVGKYMDHALTDPFDGQPLRWKAMPDGLIVYSVSKNEIDDDGHVLATKEKPQPLDVGCRLWDVSQRRLPALSLPSEYYDRLKKIRQEMLWIINEAL